MKSRLSLTSMVTVAVLSLFAGGCTASPAEVDAGPNPGVAASSPSALDLPRIPWEGGSQYWAQFAKPKVAGWSDPGFFPIVIWYNGISSDAEAEFDKSLGFNSYIGMSDTTQYRLFADNDVFWIGGKLMTGSPKTAKTGLVTFLTTKPTAALRRRRRAKNI